MLLVLKIPVVYLGVVVWWAVRAEPTFEDGIDDRDELVPHAPCGWDDWKRRRRVPRRGFRPLLPTGRPGPATVRRAQVVAR
jgi:hypothetical protein